MAKGAQDWIARTDLLLQTLSEIIQRPRYGKQYQTYLSGPLAANAENLIISLSGEGMLWGVEFWASSSATMDNDYLKLIVDGETMSLMKFVEYRDYNFTMGNITGRYGTLYDGVNFKVAGGAHLSYTWNTSYKLYYVETYGRNPVATIRFVYSLF